jgi:hypothetical protein
VLVAKNVYEKENIKGYCTDYIPDQLFVALNSEPVFYSNNYSEIDKILYNYDKNVISSDENYISRSYLEKDSGLFVNFFQPSKHFQGDPVYVTVSTTPSFIVDEDDWRKK